MDVIDVKWKYYLSNKVIACVCVIIFVIFYLAPTTSATVTIYENITIGQYKTIQITSDVCELLHATCINKWFIDEMPYGEYSDGSFVQVPNNSNVSVTLFDPLNTDLQNLPNAKTDYIIMIMTLAQTILPWFVLASFIYIVWKLQTKQKRGK